jgi:hypothetical protein
MALSSGKYINHLFNGIIELQSIKKEDFPFDVEIFTESDESNTIFNIGVSGKFSYMLTLTFTNARFPFKPPFIIIASTNGNTLINPTTCINNSFAEQWSIVLIKLSTIFFMIHSEVDKVLSS